jgi:hypothetical protein
MAGLILDSMGTIKILVLDKAVKDIQRINAMTEQLLANSKKGSASPTLVSGIKRNLTTLAAQLKSQFGMISDAVTNLYVQSSRGSNDASRARILKEGIAGIKQAIDIGYAQTKAKHAIHREKPAASSLPEG